ncbi:MAG: [Fe-S]-binding protein, partial [Phototrophicales bacterium]
IAQPTTLRARRLTSLFHLGVVWGFTFYFLVNLGDTLNGLIPNYTFLEGSGIIFELYKLIGDVLSVVVLVGIVYFIIRRIYLPNKKELEYHDNVLLHPKVKEGRIFTDSMIVAFFILFHVGARFLGEAAAVAQHGPDLAMPFATLVSPLFGGMDEQGLILARHIFWWVALGGIFLFLPYFPYTKHFH